MNHKQYVINGQLQYLDYLRGAIGNTWEYYKEFNRIKTEINDHPNYLIYENGKHNYRPFNNCEIAILYAEKYGICEFHIKGFKMFYYVTYPTEKTTYKAVVDLKTLKEIRQPLKHYYKPYKSLIGGKYQSNLG